MQLLRKLISINSVFPKEAALAMHAEKYLRACGFEVSLQEYSPGRFNVIAQKGRRAGSVLLTGHLDTVPPYNYGRRNPFEMAVRGGKILGLGSWDMKAGLALIFACADGCQPSKRGLRIVLTSDEENISEGTWFAQKHGAFSGCSIAMCHEIPDSKDNVPGKRPPILLGRRGRCVYRFKVSGIGSHGAGTDGISAVDLGMRLASALGRVPMPVGKIGPCRLFIRKFQCESTSLSVPTEAIIEADVHYVPPFGKESFMHYLRGRLKASLKFPRGCSWEIEIPPRKTPYLPAYETKRNHPLVMRFIASYEREIGKCAISYGLTVADENVLSVEKIPIITFGLQGGGAHSSGEWVSKKDFLLLYGKVPGMVQEMLD